MKACRKETTRLTVLIVHSACLPVTSVAYNPCWYCDVDGLSSSRSGPPSQKLIVYRNDFRLVKITCSFLYFSTKMSLHTLWSRWATNFSTFGRNLGSVRTFVNHAAERRVPPTRGGTGTHWLPRNLAHFIATESLGIKTPEDFLKAIGRSAETKLTVERWEDLWRLSGQDMKKAKLDVRDRRYRDTKLSYMWSI